MSKNNSGNFANIFICFFVLKFTKKMLYNSFLLYCSMCREPCKIGFGPPISQGISKKKSRNIANTGIQSYITKFIQKCLKLSVSCIALCTECFEPPHSLGTSKKKLEGITNVNIWSYNHKFID